MVDCRSWADDYGIWTRLQMVNYDDFQNTDNACIT